MKMNKIDTKAEALFHDIQKCDDALGQYSDYEGDEGGPTFYQWHRGFKDFNARCEQAIDDHRAAIKVWQKLKRLNRKRE